MISKRPLIALSMLLFATINLQSQNDKFNVLYKQILNGAVFNGNVDYSYCKANYRLLDSAYHKAIESPLFQDIDQRNAYLINVYNLCILKKVTEHYPVNSPNSIPDFFEDKWIIIDEKRRSLNELEALIFEGKEDPRIHFALVCAAKSCPPLHNRPFDPNSLNNVLDSLSKSALYNPKILVAETGMETIKISRIFEWYEHHFGGKKGVIQFIRNHRSDIDNNVQIRYLSYDWSLNDATVSTGDPVSFQQFTPSYLLGKNRLEVKTFINLYSQNQRFDDEFGKINENLRQTYFTNITEFLYGISGRLSVGGEIWYKSVYVDSNRNTTPFKLISEWSSTKKGLTGIGPRIKFTPLQRVGNLTIQSTFLFQPVDDPQGISDQSDFLDFNRQLWINTLYFDQPLDDKSTLFFRLSAWYSLIEDNKNFVETPFAIFVNYFPTSRWTMYLQNELWMKHVDKSFSSFFNQAGIGTKYQVIRKYLEIELLYTNFVLGSEGEGAGETFNLGLRFIR